MLTSFVQGILNVLSGFLSLIVSVLPGSPFDGIYTLVIDNELLSFLAWIIPFPQILSLLTAWGTAVGVWYLWSVIARWVKMVE